MTAHVRDKLWKASAWGALAAIVVSASFAAYFFWRASTESGASCTFDNFGCARNRDLGAGLSWVLCLVAVVAVSLAILALRRRRRRRAAERGEPAPPSSGRSPA
jgi:hypothetical protein